MRLVCVKWRCDRTTYCVVSALLLLLGSTLSSRAQAAGGCPANANLTLIQVVDLIGLSEDRAVELIGSCQVNFPVDGAALDRLSNAHASQRVLDAINASNVSPLTLERAKAYVDEFESQMMARQQASNRELDAATKALDAAFQTQRERASHIDPKGQFETTAEYEERKRKGQEALAQIDRKHEADQAALTAQYGNALALKNALLESQSTWLKKGSYAVPVAVVAESYNADDGLLLVRLGPEEYRFEKVAPAAAKSFYADWSKVTVSRPYTEDQTHTRVLALAGTQYSVYGQSTKVLHDIATEQASVQLSLKVKNGLDDARARAARKDYNGAITQYNAVLQLNPTDQVAIEQARDGIKQANLAIQQQRDHEKRLADLREQQRSSGIWTQTNKRLMWPLKDNGTDVSWKGAGEYCQELRTGGFSDWRFPNLSELANILDRRTTRMTPERTRTEIAILDSNDLTRKVHEPSMPYHIMGEIVLTDVVVWTSEKNPSNPGTMWLENFGTGVPGSQATGNKKMNRVLCVRTYVPTQDEIADVPVEAPPAYNAPVPIASTVPENGNGILLTRAVPSARRATVIRAPGNGLMDYKVFMIDTSDFTTGGVLDIDIQISPTSGTDGSFDLFPSVMQIPTQGRPGGTLAGRYDVRKGTTTRLEYRFKAGQVFAFGLEGNWFSPKGATGSVQFTATVRR